MRWYEMKGQSNRDSNPVPTSQETNHATNWANEAGPQEEDETTYLSVLNHCVEPIMENLCV